MPRSACSTRPTRRRAPPADPALLATQLALGGGHRESAAVQPDEPPLPRAAPAVDGHRRRLLAGPGLANHQDINVDLGDVGESLPQLLHRRAPPQQQGIVRLVVCQLRPQGPVFQHQAALLGGSPHAVDQAVGRVGLLEEVVGALAHGLDRHGYVAVPGDEDHRQVGIELDEPPQQSETVHAGQPHVRDDDARELRAERRLGGLRGRESPHLEARELQALRVGAPHLLVVVDEDDACAGRRGHGAPLSSMANTAPPPGCPR